MGRSFSCKRSSPWGLDVIELHIKVGVEFALSPPDGILYLNIVVSLSRGCVLVGTVLKFSGCLL